MPKYMVDEQVETEHGIYRFRLEQDDDTSWNNPRDFDCQVAVIVAQAARYILPQEGDHVRTILDALDRRDGMRAVARWLRICHGATVVLPLYLRGDDTLSPGDAADLNSHNRWNVVGLAYDTPATRAVLGEDATTEQVEGSIRSELDEYGKWATGEVYGYVVERVDEDGNVLDDFDSCWGHIGDEWAAEAGSDALAYVIEDEGEKYAAAQAEIASDEAEIADLAACELGMPAVTL